MSNRDFGKFVIAELNTGTFKLNSGYECGITSAYDILL